MLVPFGARAGCGNTNAMPGSSSTRASTYENFGIYDWDAGAQAWVLDSAGNLAFVEDETLQAGDIAIDRPHRDFEFRRNRLGSERPTMPAQHLNQLQQTFGATHGILRAQSYRHAPDTMLSAASR